MQGTTKGITHGIESPHQFWKIGCRASSDAHLGTGKRETAGREMDDLVDCGSWHLVFCHCHVRRNGPWLVEGSLLSSAPLRRYYSGVPLQPNRRRVLENQSKRKNLSAVWQAWINSLSDQREDRVRMPQRASVRNETREKIGESLV
jgi:hypothetical protein